MIGNTISPHSGFIMNILLQKNFSQCKKNGKSLPFSLSDLMKEILAKNSSFAIKEPKIKELIIQLKDEFKFISSWGFNDDNSPTYVINFENISEKIKSKTLEKLLSQEYSPMHLRVYRLLNKCGALDSKTV